MQYKSVIFRDSLNLINMYMFIHPSPPHPGQHGAAGAVLPPPPPLPQTETTGRDTGSLLLPLGQSLQTWSPSPSSQREGEHRAGRAETEREGILQSEDPEVVCCVVTMVINRPCPLANVRRVFCGTWNVNGKLPPSSLDQFLREFEGQGDSGSSVVPDVYVIGLVCLMHFV